MSSSLGLSFYKEPLQQIISRATNIDDLLPILRSISMGEIKNFITQNLEFFDLPSCRKTYFESTSITGSLSMDMNQHILSFLTLDSNHIKSVSKTWNVLSQQNEFNHYRAVQKSMEENGAIQYDPNKTKICIVDQRRSKLSQMERKLGYLGPFQCIGDSLTK